MSDPVRQMWDPDAYAAEVRFVSELGRPVIELLAPAPGERILDLGCGSAQHLARVLKGRRIAGYVGYDLSETALVRASRNLAELGCPVDLRLGDLSDGVGSGEQKFDLLFSSFALHHVSATDKREFFRSAHRRLIENGSLLLIDTMRDDGEDRTAYLERYCAWLRRRCPMLSEEAFDLLAAHIRDNDFAETTADLREMASTESSGTVMMPGSTCR